MDDPEIEQGCARAREHLSANRFSEAEQEFLTVLRRRPACADALHGIGQLALRANQLPKAHAAFGAALESAPDNVPLIIEMARCSAALGNSDEAEVFARLAIAVDHSSIEGH